MPALRSLIIVSMMVTPPTVSASDNTPATNDPVADKKAIVQSGNARFTVLTPGVIRMEYAPDGKFDDRASYVIVNRHLPVPEFRHGPFAEVCDLSGEWLPEKLNKATGIKTDRIALAYVDDGKPFSKTNLMVWTRKPGSGWDDTRQCSPPFASQNNLGGTVRTLDGVNGSIPLPDGILSRDGWYCLNDSQSLMFDANSPAGEGAGRYKDDPWITPRNRPGYIDWYFMSYGHDYKQALKDYISIAGRIPMPPRFAFGTWWSRYWDYTDAELRQLVKEFKEHDVPLDVLVIDMGWHLDGWTGYTWNPKCFPDPEGFLKWVHEQGLKATLNLHPADGVGKHEKAFPEMCKAMGLDPARTDVVPFDCTDRKYMDAYFKYLHHPLEAMGIDFWWMDWQQGKQTKMQGLDPLPWINYLHWHDMEKRAAETGKRPLLFSRWGGLGNHRYQIGFSGDTFSTWQSLAFQPYFTATAGNVGYAYWSHDIGGHMPGKVDPELYTRWIQWGALSPILRTHTTKNPEAERRIWAYPPEYFDAMKKAFELRYELIPYIYTAARQCYDTGLPICRPLYYEWPDLDEAYKHPGEYMFGDQMLAAPVTEPSDPISKCAMVEVWLPPGKWTNWFTGRTYTGPGTFPLVVPLEEIPLFVKDGGIVVTQPKRMRADDASPSDLVINAFPGDNGTITIYDDDGRSQRYTADSSSTVVELMPAHDGTAIEIDSAAGDVNLLAKNRRYSVTLHDSLRPTGVKLNEKLYVSTAGEVTESNPLVWSYDPNLLLGRVRVRSFPADAKTRIATLCHARPATDGPIRWGLAGFLNTVQSVGSALNVKMDAIADKQTPSNEPAIRSLSELAHAIRDSLATSEVKGRALIRLLGLYYHLHVSTKDAVSRVLNANCEFTSTYKLGALPILSGRIELTLEPGFTVPGETSLEFQSLNEEKPQRVRAEISLGQSLQTSIVTAQITVKSSDFDLDIPLKQVVLPSINAWYILGPFENPSVEGLNREFPPDKKVDLAAEYDGKGGKKIKWRKFERRIKPGDDLTGEFFVDFDDVFGDRVYECMVYGFTFLDAPEDMDAVLAVGTDDGCAVVLNGQEVFRIEVGRAYISKQDRVPVKLKKGQNTLLLKVFQGGGDGGLCVHIEDKDGRPLTQVKPRL